MHACVHPWAARLCSCVVDGGLASFPYLSVPLLLQVEDVLTYHKQRMKTDMSNGVLQLLVGRCVHSEYKGLPQIRKEQVRMRVCGGLKSNNREEKQVVEVFAG